MELFGETTAQQTSQETKVCIPGDSESVGRSITDFHYGTDMRLKFPNWFICYEDLFTVELKKQADKGKVRLLSRKLGLAEHNRYLNYILPKHPQDYNFAETVEILKQIFGACTINIHFNYLNITKCDTGDFTT